MLYDLIIIGSGPAGLNASLYASRSNMRHALIGQMPGGVVSNAFQVENYLGFPSMRGMELAQKFIEHVKQYSPEIINNEAIELKKNKEIFEIKLANKQILTSKTVLLALGAIQRKLNIPGEKEFFGKGVAYCATCDGPLFKDKVVAVAGGGDSALTATLFLAQIAEKVYLIHRRKEFRGQEVWQDKIAEKNNIIKILENEIIEIKGQSKIQEIILKNPSQFGQELKVDGLFIEIGSIPGEGNLKMGVEIELKKNKAGYIETNYLTQTNISGLFAAGDIAGPADKVRQIVTAAAEGAVAALSAHRFCQKKLQKSK